MKRDATEAELAAEDEFLAEMGLGADGTPMVLGDETPDGFQWRPEAGE